MNRAAMAIDRPPDPVPFGEALRFWLKLGFVSFGGPAGQISVMFHELVEGRRWISERRFLHALNYCMLLPGPEAQQLATYIGWLMHRTAGGLVAGCLFVLPSLAILVLLSWIYVAFGDVPAVAAVFYGIKPAVAAIVLHAAFRIGRRALDNGVLWAIAVAAFLALFAFDVPFPVVIACAALIGALGSRLAPARFAMRTSHALHAQRRLPALIDDDTPTPAHARFTRARLARVVVAGVATWLVLLGFLVAAFEWQSTLAQMAWFFTKAALLTFGGAYAVLPYVYQGAVEHHGWLTGPQMIAGLALGETTPGPLIMVVAFVGYLGAVAQAVAGDVGFVAGLAGAVVATVFTFLPSFVFIFAGAPLIESTHGDLRFTAPLTAITAAVVGVIVNLAMYFGGHVFWPDGRGGPFDAAAGVIALAAAIALFRFRAGVIPLIAAAAIAGLAWRLALN
jgi:chromate transporter